MPIWGRRTGWGSWNCRRGAWCHRLWWECTLCSSTCPGRGTGIVQVFSQRAQGDCTLSSAAWLSSSGSPLWPLTRTSWTVTSRWVSILLTRRVVFVSLSSRTEFDARSSCLFHAPHLSLCDATWKASEWHGVSGFLSGPIALHPDCEPRYPWRTIRWKVHENRTNQA